MDFNLTANQSTVRAGTEIRVKTEKLEVGISLTEMAKDPWVVFESPGFANVTSGKAAGQHRRPAQGDRDIFQGPDAIWVKLVIPAAPKGVGMDQFLTGDQASITVRR